MRPDDASSRRALGPGRSLSVPSEAAKIAGDGDVVGISAAFYEGDVAIWPQNDLTIRGVGGRAHVGAGRQLAEDKGIWVIKGRNATVEHVELSRREARTAMGAGFAVRGSARRASPCGRAIRTTPGSATTSRAGRRRPTFSTTESWTRSPPRRAPASICAPGRSRSRSATCSRRAPAENGTLVAFGGGPSRPTSRVKGFDYYRLGEGRPLPGRGPIRVA